MIIFILSCSLTIFHYFSAFDFEGDLSLCWSISWLWDCGVVQGHCVGWLWCQCKKRQTLHPNNYCLGRRGWHACWPLALCFLQPPSSRACTQRNFWQCVASATTSRSKPNPNTCVSKNSAILHWTFASKFCKASFVVNYIFLFFCLAHCRWKLYFSRVLIGNARDTLRFDKPHTFVTLELVLQYPELAIYSNARCYSMNCTSLFQITWYFWQEQEY